jgi:SAM-dependent MidA family methyltransferase
VGAAALASDPFLQEIAFGARDDGTPVHWHWRMSEVPSSDPVLIIGHEFLDALPVHQFLYTKDGWRERLVDIDEGNGSAL